MLPPARPSSSSISVEERSVAMRDERDELSDKTLNGHETAELPLWPPRRRRRQHSRRHSPTNRHERRQEKRRRRRTASCSSRFGQREAALATASEIAVKTANSQLDVSPAEQQQQQPQKTDEGRERIWNGIRRPQALGEERQRLGEERRRPKVVLTVTTRRTCSSPLPATANNTNTSRCSRRRLWLKKAAAVVALLLLFYSMGCYSAGQRLMFGKSDWRLLLAAFRCDVVDALCQLDAAVCQRRCPPGRLSFLADNNNY